MALRALTLAGARLELSLMWIDGVAVDALRKGQLLLEIASDVALAAAHLDVRALQRIFCFGMVELHSGNDLFPAGRGVAGLARSLELALVRIAVAVAAGREFNARELHRFFRAGGEVALFAGHLRVLAGQRILGLGVVKLLGLLPVSYVVAGLAIGPQLPFVDVLMAGHTGLRQAHQGCREIFFLDQAAQRRNHVGRRMALLAGHRRMFFHQRISRQAMIELLERRLPVDQ